MCWTMVAQQINKMSKSILKNGPTLSGDRLTRNWEYIMEWFGTL